MPHRRRDTEERLRAALAARPRGLFTDIDGTISPIAPTPDQARLLPGIADLLQRAHDVFDIVAVVSGRSPRDRRRLVNVPGLVYIGNHGLEYLDPIPSLLEEAGRKVRTRPEARQYIGQVSAVLDRVEGELAGRYPGLLVERKGVTGSIHVRGTADPDEAERVVAHLVTEEAHARGLRVTHGKRVLEVRPPVEVDKGTAVADVIQSAGLKSAIYLGDDRTDIDAFHTLRRLTEEGVCLGVSLAVLHAESPRGLRSAADDTLESVQQVPSLLAWLIEHA